MLVIGGGIIGLKWRRSIIRRWRASTSSKCSMGLMPGADRDLVKVWERKCASFRQQHHVERRNGRRRRRRPGSRSRSKAKRRRRSPQVYDSSRRRRPQPQWQEDRCGKAGVAVGERRSSPSTSRCARMFRISMRSATSSASPCLRTRPCTSACRRRSRAWRATFFDARQIRQSLIPIPKSPGPARLRKLCKAEGPKAGKAVLPWRPPVAPSPTAATRASRNWIFDETTHRIVGGGIVGTNAGDLIGEVCLAVEMGAPADIGKTIHPHPTLVESIGMAAVFSCHVPDLPPQKKEMTCPQRDNC